MTELAQYYSQQYSSAESVFNASHYSQTLYDQYNQFDLSNIDMRRLDLSTLSVDLDQFDLEKIMQEISSGSYSLSQKMYLQYLTMQQFLAEASENGDYEHIIDMSTTSFSERMDQLRLYSDELVATYIQQYPWLPLALNVGLTTMFSCCFLALRAWVCRFGRRQKND